MNAKPALSRPALLAGAVLFIGLCGSALTTIWHLNKNEREAQKRFDHLADGVASEVAKRMHLYEYGLRGTRSAFLTNALNEITRKDFINAAESRDLDHEFPGARGFGVIKRVPERDEAAFVAAAKKDDWPDFSIRQLKPHTGERYVIQYIEPVARNRAAVGLDIASEANRREAAQNSMRSGEVAITGPITLVQATGKSLRSFLVMLPIYQPGASLASPAQREAATLGWSYAPLVIDEVLNGVKGIDWTSGEFTLALRDVDGDDVQNFFTSPDAQAQGIDGLHEEIVFPLFGRKWSADVRATPAFFENLGQTHPREVAANGVLVAAVLALLTYMLAVNGLRRRELHAEQSRSAAIVEGSNDAIIGETLNGTIASWNKGAERLFGYQAAVAIGCKTIDLLLPEDLAAEDTMICTTLRRGERVEAFDTVRKHQDGSLIDVSVAASPIFGPKGESIGFAKTIRDIREARRAQLELAELNTSLENLVETRTAELDNAMHNLRGTVDAVPSMIAYWDKNLVNRMANRSYAAWFGQEPAAMVGQPMRAVCGDMFVERNWPNIEAALRGEPQKFERRLEKPDGSRVQPSLVHYQPDVIAGDVRGFYVLVHDMGEIVEGQIRLTAALRDNEALLDTLDQHAIVSVADAAGRIMEVNARFCAVSGYSQEELLGQNHRIVNSGQHPESFWQDMWYTISSGEPWRGEICNRAKDGSLYWVDSMIAPFVGADGQIEKYISIRTDITARKQAEESLRLTSKRFEVAAEAAAIGVWERDLGTNTLVWDDQMYAHFGCTATPDATPLDLWARGVHPQDLPDCDNAMAAAIADSGKFEQEFRVLQPDGTIRHLKGAAVVLRNASGNPLRMIGVNIDVTDHRHAVQQAQMRERLTSLVINSFPGPLAYWDTDMRCTLANAAYKGWLGLTSEQMVGKTQLEIIGEEIYQLNLPHIQAVLSGKEQKVERTRTVADGSERHYQLQYFPDMVGNEVRGFISVVIDITDLKRSEQQMRQAVHKARHANQAKSQFLANMSHEIRTPMNAVIGLTYLMERTALDADQTSFMGKIKNASHSLLGLINDILDLSKIEAQELTIEKAPFSLSKLLGDVTDLMKDQGQSKGIDLVLDAHSGLPDSLEGDAVRLRQVLVNLVANSIKFTERGFVRLDVQCLSDATAPSDDASQVRLRFEVEDTGIGMSPDVMSKLFMPFAQGDVSTTRRFGGTGLGLSIVKQLVTMMGGEIGVSSKPGEGSTFWFELTVPTCSGDGLPSSPGSDNPADSPLGLAGVRILVADDNAVNLEVARRILELEGATISMARNGQEAIDHLLAKPRGFDVVLMDVQMPVLDGHDATRRIRSGLGLKNLPIIALTAGALASEQQGAEAAGMNDFITKPFDPAALVRCIRRHVAPSSSVDKSAEPETEDNLSPDWPLIDGIDAQDVSRRLCGDANLFRSMLKRMLADFVLLEADVISSADDPSELPRLARRLHNLKGSAGTLGATELHHIATQAEAACRAGEGSVVKDLAVNLAGQLERLGQSAEAVLAQANSQPESAATDTSTRLDAREFKTLMDHLHQSDFDASAQFNQLATALRLRMGNAAFAVLREQMDNLQFDEAARTLSPLQGQEVAQA